jgi:hypothetical protein
MRCTPTLKDTWTIVRYFDPSDNSTVSADMATDLLNQLTVKQTSLPVVEVEKTPVKGTRQRIANQTEPKQEVVPNKEAMLWEAELNRSEQPNRQSPKAVQAWSPAFILSGLGLFIAGIVVHKRNAKNRASRLFYELDEVESRRFQTIQEAQTHLAASHRIWRIEGQSATSDWKRNAGASSLVRRFPISTNCSNPPRVETNLATPCVNLGRARLYFLPDIVLYWEHGTFGAISYDDFQVEQSLTRFIEDGPVPADATVVDQTWRYVNKGGGPDRRFNNNVQLPVVQYGVLLLKSSRGLNIHLNTSNAQASFSTARCWHALSVCAASRQQAPSNATRESVGPSNQEVQAFKLLGLTAGASPVEISAAYHRLAQMYHPDKVAGLAPEFQALADLRMKEINAAHQLLLKGG